MNVSQWPIRRVSAKPGVDQTPTGVFVVTDPEVGDVVVRLRPQQERRWGCAHCGTRTELADCFHTFAVGIHLAETVLGLTRVPTDRSTT